MVERRGPMWDRAEGRPPPPSSSSRVEEGFGSDHQEWTNMTMRHAPHPRRIEFRPSVNGLEDRVVLNGSMMTTTPTPINPAAISLDVATTKSSVKLITESLSRIDFALFNHPHDVEGRGALAAVQNLNTNASTAVTALQNDQSLLNSFYTQTLASLEQQRQSMISQLQTNLEEANSNLNHAWADLTPEEQDVEAGNFANAYNLAFANTVAGINATQTYYVAQEQALANNYIQVNQEIAQAMAIAQQAVQKSANLESELSDLVFSRNRIPIFTPTTP
jgi:hypothetical protein